MFLIQLRSRVLETHGTILSKMLKLLHGAKARPWRLDCDVFNLLAALHDFHETVHGTLGEKMDVCVNNTWRNPSASSRGIQQFRR